MVQPTTTDTRAKFNVEGNGLRALILRQASQDWSTRCWSTPFGFWPAKPSHLCFDMLVQSLNTLTGEVEWLEVQQPGALDEHLFYHIPNATP